MRCYLKTFGDKNELALEYEKSEGSDESVFNLFIQNSPVCMFRKNMITRTFKWKIDDLVEWLETNLDNILVEEGFPLPVDAKTAVDFMEKSSNFETDDDAEFDSWYEQRQDWSFRHSWYSSRAGGYLADVFFRKVGDMIEVSWNNHHLYTDIEFLHPSGVFYVGCDTFENVITHFIASYKNDTR